MMKSHFILKFQEQYTSSEKGYLASLIENLKGNLKQYEINCY
jgi:hypothetical protein